MRTKSRSKYTCEEVFLFGIYRLVNPGKYSRRDIADHFGYTSKPIASMAFNLFLSHMVNQWGYLLTNNTKFWAPYMAECAEAIREKCREKGCYFTPDFCVFGFIDNTMNSTCRPGGGPARDGVNMPRNDPLIQEAWYNGWKKLHGIKWQTADLPNGMNFHVTMICIPSRDPTLTNWCAILKPLTVLFNIACMVILPINTCV